MRSTLSRLRGRVVQIKGTVVFSENFTGHANTSVHRETGIPGLHPEKEMLTLWAQSHGTDTVMYLSRLLLQGPQVEKEQL